MSDRQLAAVALVSLWAAVASLAVLVVRALGWSRVKPQKVTLVVLAAALLVLPSAAVWRKALLYKERLLAIVLRKHSAPVALGNGCSIFPQNNIWNTPVRDLPVDANSAAYIQSIGPELPLHADFGAASGMAYAVTSGELPVATVAAGSPESDAGPYRIPDDAPVENGTDRHVLILDSTNCRLYELYDAVRKGPLEWEAGSGAIFDLRANRLRPEGWTSADGAGLPILPGLVRYEEARSGPIRHALRFTARRTRRAFVWPARHFASQSNDPHLPPMGQRFRLRATVPTDGFAPETQAILNALKEYGMMLADNGGPWFLSGAPDSGWSRRVIEELRQIKGADFEAVDIRGLEVEPGSAEARRP